jgi:hypothetical protein
MTEAEWLACTEPERLLKQVADPSAKRKLRLVACACARQVWPLLAGPRRQLVEAAERLADRRPGQRGPERELGRLRHRATLAVVSRAGQNLATVFAAAAAEAVGVENQHEAACEAAVNAARAAAWEAAYASCPPGSTGRSLDAWNAVWEVRDNAHALALREARTTQSHYVRDIFGNPFRPPAVDPVWLHWRGGSVVHLARAIYDEGRFGDLPVLGDALEEAGCGDRDLLRHCRARTPHVRGCWVVDAVRAVV